MPLNPWRHHKCKWIFSNYINIVKDIFSIVMSQLNKAAS